MWQIPVLGIIIAVSLLAVIFTLISIGDELGKISRRLERIAKALEGKGRRGYEHMPPD